MIINVQFLDITCFAFSLGGPQVIAAQTSKRESAAVLHEGNNDAERQLHPQPAAALQLELEAFELTSQQDRLLPLLWAHWEVICTRYGSLSQCN